MFACVWKMQKERNLLKKRDRQPRQKFSQEDRGWLRDFFKLNPSGYHTRNLELA